MKFTSIIGMIAVVCAETLTADTELATEVVAQVDNELATEVASEVESESEAESDAELATESDVESEDETELAEVATESAESESEAEDETELAEVDTETEESRKRGGKWIKKTGNKFNQVKKNIRIADRKVRRADHKLRRAGRELKHLKVRVLGKARRHRRPSKYEGNLVRIKNKPAVFLVVDGKVRHVPNPRTYFQLWAKWGDVKSISAKGLARRGRRGRAITNRAYLVKAKGGRRVYLVVDGRKRWIRNRKSFNKFHFSWKKIRTVSKRALRKIRTGRNIRTR